MSDAVRSSIVDFCNEMRRLASLIDAPDEMVPFCGREDRHGWSIDASSAGEYVYSASDRGIPYDLVRSHDASIVMEAVFVDLTERMAMEVVVDRYPPLTVWSRFNPFRRQVDPLKQQREIQLVQEELLGRVNEAWRYRAASANALQLRRNLDFFMGLE